MTYFGQLQLIWSLFKVTTIFRKPKLFTRLYASDFIPGLVKLMSLLLIADENLFKKIKAIFKLMNFSVLKRLIINIPLQLMIVCYSLMIEKDLIFQNKS